MSVAEDPLVGASQTERFASHGVHGQGQGNLANGIWGRLSQGILASVFTLGVSYTTNFLLVPVILQHWGPAGFSLWVTLFATVAYLSLIDLGGQNYVQNLLAISYARNDAATFRSTLSQGFALYLWLGGIVCCGWFCLLLLGRAVNVPGLGRPLAAVEMGVLAWLGAQQFLLAVPFGVFVTCYRASGKFTRGTLLGNVTKMMLFLGSIALVSLGGGPAWLAMIYFAVGLVSATLFLIDARRAVPEAYPLDLSWRSACMGLGVLKGSFFNWLLSLSNLLNQQVPLLTLAGVSSPPQVTLFATHRMIANLAGYSPSIVVGPILPELSFLWSLKEMDKFRRLTVRAIVSVVMTTSVASLALFFIVPMFFNHWTVGKVHYDWLLLLLLLLQGISTSTVTVMGWTMIATNRHRAYCLSSLGYSLILIILAISIVPQWGASGLVCAIIVLDIAFLAAVVFALTKQLHVELTKDVARALGRTLLLLAAVVAPQVALWWSLPVAWRPPVMGFTETAVAVLVFLYLRRRWADSPEESFSKEGGGLKAQL